MWKEFSVNVDQYLWNLLQQRCHKTCIEWISIFLWYFHQILKKLRYININIIVNVKTTFNPLRSCATFAGLTCSSLYISLLDVYYSMAYKDKTGDKLLVHSRELIKYLQIRYYGCSYTTDLICLWWSGKVSELCVSVSDTWKARMLSLYEPTDMVHKQDSYLGMLV